jgi:hypothetical protein
MLLLLLLWRWLQLLLQLLRRLLGACRPRSGT